MIYSFYHITDVHYYSKKNFACDYKKLPQPNTEICIMVSEESFRKALDIIRKDEDTNTVIITGDLTNHGDEYSHNEVRDLLAEFTADGGNPYVVSDSHDYPEFFIYSIDENGKKIPAVHLPREEVVQIYNPFGRNKGFNKYQGDDTTYIAEILPGLYYITLGYDFLESGAPSFSDELMAWVKEQTQAVKSKGGIVICGTHRPIVTPSPAYEVMGKNNTFINGEKRAKEFADMGIRLFFSGHTHIQRMIELVSDKGNRIYSVQTASLAGFPPKMRKITIDTENGTVDVATIDMDLSEPDLGMSFTEYARKGFLGIVEAVPYNMEHNIEAFLETEGGITLPEDLITKFPKIVMFIGKKINSLTYGKVARFSRKYHGMSESEYAEVKDKQFIKLLFDMVSNMYKGNAASGPDTVEYKIVMGTMKKLEKLFAVLHIDQRKLLSGYTLTEIAEPLLYNSGLDDDNVTLKVDFS